MTSRAPIARPNFKPAFKPASRQEPMKQEPAKSEPKILFQKFFKSVGPRTYVAQVKEVANGNHLLVLTEGKRDDKTGEIRKTRLFTFSEDFVAFFRMLHETAQFIKANPLDPKIKAKREKFWAKREAEDRKPVGA